MEHVGRLTQLKRLDLEGCEITDAGLKPLKNLTQLETLDLRNTKVTAQGVKELQQALPHCEISH
jgi:Leucine-rich repeat (LRR) protein